jgi:hypothetical protein
MNLIPTLMPSLNTRKSERPEKDVSIIIAHRGSELGLWATIHSCEIELQNSGLTYEFIIIPNGETPSVDLKRQEHYFTGSGVCGDWIPIAEPTAPPVARQIGSASARGKYLFFFDNHCLPCRGYFHRAISMIEKHDMGMLHSTTRFWAGEGDHYEYHLSLNRDFWTDRPYKDPMHPTDPYRVPMAGHGGFVVKRSVWEEVGGYWQGFVGYGGEETYFDFKLWLLGKTVWIDPQLIHYHWSGKRDYVRHFTDDYFRNMFMCANIIGGEHWLDKVYRSMSSFPRLSDQGVQPTPMFDILMEAQAKSQPHANQIREKQVITLDNLMVWFNTQNIRAVTD